MKTTLYLQNLKCGGCETTVKKGMDSVYGISEVDVDANAGAVTFEYQDDRGLEEIFQKLSHMGYPVDGEANPLSKKVKSYLSCAKGRFA